MNIALILFALPLIAITFLIINNITLSIYKDMALPSYILEEDIRNGNRRIERRGEISKKEKKEEKQKYIRSIKPKYRIIFKEKKDIIISLILSIINLLIIIIALL